MHLSKQVTIIVLLFLSTCSFAQNRIGYQYDATGNRIRKAIILSTNADMEGTKPLHGALERMYTDQLSAHKVEISPNPTEGVIHISIDGMKEGERCHLDLFNMQGAFLQGKIMDGNSVTMDLHDLPFGIYVLKINLNKITTTWKIIKR